MSGEVPPIHESAPPASEPGAPPNEPAELPRETTAGPDRWRSAMWALLFPGFGQIANGQRALGGSLIAAFWLCAVFAVLAFTADAVPVWIAAPALLAGLAIVPLSIVHAYRRAAPVPVPPASAWRAAFWSHVFPGLGQLIERRFASGLGFLTGLALAASIEGDIPSDAAIAAVSVAATLDALRRSKRPRAPWREAGRMAIAVAVLGGLSTVAVATVRARMLQPFRLASESMAPTLRLGDFVMVDRTRAGRAAPGELIMVRYPQDRTKLFLKRCVATAGQRVELRDQGLIIDDRPVPEPFVQHTDSEIRSSTWDVRDNFGPIVVPENTVFVLGDNRENSNDSRYFGPVALADVHGRAIKIYWPPSHWNARLHFAR